MAEHALTPANPTAHSPTGPSDKSALAAFLFCLFLGVFGAHRFYVGRNKTGVAQLLTQGGFVIWAVIDLVLIVLGRFKDSEERPVTRWS
ncbi:hypothetical protein BW247_05560 [Acidihalobacter ferrooxydans]|uniref:TM2 domain-containing protein n=1 Tax=Acidihalobacter ferrooxydans TaxID=1765967 RepID=A0A1P8UL29_9GAMM|nr:hypothetical protein BW247_05560 [Acidihalobacter ferrooxydans]